MVKEVIFPSQVYLRQLNAFKEQLEKLETEFSRLQGILQVSLNPSGAGWWFFVSVRRKSRFHCRVFHLSAYSIAKLQLLNGKMELVVQ